MDELAAVDAYCDAVPRSAATVEEYGTCRLFVPTDASFHPWYARPSGTGPVSGKDLTAVLRRQQQLGLPGFLEWISGRPRGVEKVAGKAGLSHWSYPLLVARPAELVWSSTADVRLVSEDLDLVEAVAQLGFAHPGTAIGPVGVEALVVDGDVERSRRRQARVAAGRPTVVAAYVDGQPVARGGHTLIDGVSEITGVATLPAFRRRGLGTAVTAALAGHAVRGGAELLWLSADDEAVARVYRQLGFRDIGRSGAAA